MAKITDIYNFRPVDSKLSTSGQPAEDQLRAIAAHGYEVVINLALHDDPDYSLPDEAGLVQALGLSYVHIPVRFDAPQERDLLAFFDAMNQYKNHKIHVHCAANMRVTTFLGLYRLLQQNQSEKNAFEIMRSVWEPNDIWSLFISDMLAKYAR